MKKALLHIGIFILFSAQMACSHGEDEPEDITTISVNKPGSLSEIIAPSQRGSITKLAVKGSLNYSDISYIRQMPELLYLDVGNVVLPNNYFPDNAISSHEKLEADSPCIARFYRSIGISMVRKVASRPPAQKT